MLIDEVLLVLAGCCFGIAIMAEQEPVTRRTGTICGLILLSIAIWIAWIS